MSTSNAFPQERIDAVRQVVQRAWLKLQMEYEDISDGCIAMSISDKQVLTMVAAHRDIILRDIREVLGMPNSTLTGAIDRLENRGLVKRTLTKRDRRSFGLELTDGGKAYVALQNQAENDLAIRILQALGSEGDQETFIAVLSRVIAGLGKG
ncbi:MarR family winged helix-turn-helix transcriptional regulator [Candidatus Bipolaricaulota bacterium]|nr:MarR family winged helix-turn-helix transcriptional regulator [Candidatus Bipolaricaulota bacterium]